MSLSKESPLEKLKSRLSEFEFYFKKSLGQNFLISRAVIEQILTEAQKSEGELILEIGPGLGALTDGLKGLERPLKLIELDSRICEFWRQQGIEVIETDALKWDWQLEDTDSAVTLVSNLPYQISSSLIIDRCFGPCHLREMILMFQKEVAQRIQAKAGSSAYGLLTVMAQLHFDIKKVCDAGPKDFFPPPKVASRVLKFKRKPSINFESAAILKLLKIGFGQRRKKLLGNLKSSGIFQPDQLKAVENWLIESGYSANARAEELAPPDWVKLESLRSERAGAKN